ncbi:MAG TPA: SAM-dependent methyltransferase [Streptosporangiaceae bacterium]|jgi:O-methyltransferase involved in polyketide biosynthesis|nr:SAM-dependent methyltransferase [Streptosporangiaceae bacterium]
MASRSDWLKDPDDTGPVSRVVLKTHIPHPARIYDYLLGGKDNFPADREAADGITRCWPSLPKSMRANRDFLARMAHHLAAEQGIRQFLDIGTGLPTAPNLHEVAQAIAPETRIVYVDNDPIVLVHARALLAGTPEGRTTYIDADLRDPDSILASACLRETLDFDRPIALTLIAIMHYIEDEREAADIIARLMRPLAPGSMLAISTTTHESNPEEVLAGIAAYRARGIPVKERTKAEVEALFTGMDMLPPGITLINHWHPAPGRPVEDDRDVQMYGGVARKP